MHMNTGMYEYKHASTYAMFELKLYQKKLFMKLRKTYFKQ